MGSPLTYHLHKQFEQAAEITLRACEEHELSHAFLLFSGGYDSFVMTHLLAQILITYRAFGYPVPQFTVVHVNTGISIPQTREFVRKMATRYDWPFVEYTTPERYEDIVRTHGFPGPASHRFMYIRLKERALDALMRDHTPQYHEADSDRRTGCQS